MRYDQNNQKINISKVYWTIAIIGYKRKSIVSIIPYIDVATTTTAETTKNKDTEKITAKGIIIV